MTDREPSPDIELDAIVAVHGFLLEIAFTLICRLDPAGEQAAFRAIEGSILDMLRRTVADPDAVSPRAVQVSNEASGN